MVSHVAGVSHREDRSRWEDMAWMARQDIRRDWAAYVVSALYLLLFGALAAPRGSAGLGTWTPEILMPVLAMLIAQPFLSLEYFAWGEDKLARRLGFLRSLPIPVETIVGGRMLAMMAALVLNVPAFFLPYWAIGEWDISRMEYAWFALFWTGLAIGISGYSIVMEMSTSIKRYSMFNLVVILAVFVVITVAGVVGDWWMVRGSVRLVEDYGPAIALAGLAIGIGGFLFGGRLATEGLRRRNLAP